MALVVTTSKFAVKIQHQYLRTSIELTHQGWQCLGDVMQEVDACVLERKTCNWLIDDDVHISTVAVQDSVVVHLRR